MNILSKNAPLETSIAKVEKILSDLNHEIVFAAEKHPLSHCYSVNLAAKKAPTIIYTNGKGSLSLSSKASALGEYIERLATNHFFIDFYVPDLPFYPDEVLFDIDDEGYLTPELKQFYDPRGEWSGEELIDFNSDHYDQIVTLPFIEMSSGDTVYFPQNILANLYASNGLSAGNTPKEAQVQSLSEICERYVKFAVIKEGYSLPLIPAEALASVPGVLEDAESLRKEGYVIKIHDASLGGVYPVCAISLINPKNHTLFVSFGAHPIFEVAIERTMTELMQGRDMGRLDDFEMPTFERSLVEDSLNLESHFIDSNGKMGMEFLCAKPSFGYAPWGYAGNGTDAEFEYLCGIFARLGKKIYLRGYDYLEMYACQIVVPGVSEVYPIEDMVYNNKNGGKRYRDAILNAEEYDPQEVLEEIEGLSDAINAGKFIGVVFEEDFTVGLLKAQLQLWLGNYSRAAEIFSYEKHPYAPLMIELITLHTGDYDVETYKQGLDELFTPEAVQTATEILEGERNLVNFALSQEYYAMLELAESLHEVKAAYYGS